MALQTTHEGIHVDEGGGQTNSFGKTKKCRQLFMYNYVSSPYMLIKKD
jgi:hypothetical protein